MSAVEPIEVEGEGEVEGQAELTEARPVVDLALPEPEPEALVPEHLTPEGLSIVPPQDEMRALVQLAVTLSAAQLVPKALRDKPNDVLLVLLTARDLGVKLTTALRLCYPIDGQVTVAPKLKLAIIRERKLGRVWPDPANDEHEATWYAIRADDPEITYQSTFTTDDAETAGGLLSKDNWRNYPKRMLSWRALGYLMDDAFGEVGSGLYSPDELGAITDDEGSPILDVTEVGPLEGTAEPRSVRKARERAERGPAPGDELASREDRDEIDALLRSLPEAGLDEAKRLWVTAVAVKVADLPVKRLTTVRALLASLVKRAEAGEWGDWTAPSGQHWASPERSDAQSPVEAPEGDPAPVAHPEGSETQEEPDSPSSGDVRPEPPDWFPEASDIEEVIDWVKDLPIGQVDEHLIDLTGLVIAEGTSENDRRHDLAVRIAGDLGLL